MKEIKFRAWDRDKRQLEYQFDKTICAEDGLEFNLICFRFMDGGMPVITTFATCLKYTQRYILNQFTGLKDKNGVEIYEGDVLTPNYGGNRVVRFGSINIEDNEMYGSNDCVGFYLYDGLPCHMDNQDEFEVIGNRFENPELMNNENK